MNSQRILSRAFFRTDERFGQAVYNAASEILSEIWQGRFPEEIDPFYNDANVEAFLDYCDTL